MEDTTETDEYGLRAYGSELLAAWVYLHVYSVCLSVFVCICVVDHTRFNEERCI